MFTYMENLLHLQKKQKTKQTQKTVFDRKQHDATAVGVWNDIIVLLEFV